MSRRVWVVEGPRTMERWQRNQSEAIYWRGASLASIAASSPMEVRMITSARRRKPLAPPVKPTRGAARCISGRREKLTGVLLLSLEETGDLLTNLTIGQTDVVLGVTIIAHEGKETIVSNVELAHGQSICR